MSITWGAYMRDNNFEKIDIAGAALSNHISCAVHYPAYDKRLFECKCGIIFPVWAVEAAIMTDKWEDIDNLHRGLVVEPST